MTIADIRKHMTNGGTLAEIEQGGGRQLYRLQDLSSFEQFLDVIAFRAASGAWIYRLVS